MNSAVVIEIAEVNRHKILEAAFARFRRYGYTKTTMAEIADDCAMSAANLYRFFRNKQDIASACVENCIQERLSKIKNSIDHNYASATDQLRALVYATLHHCHEIYARDEKLYELIGYITDERPQVVHNKIHILQTEIKAILEFGNQTGEFVVSDTDETASAIYTAIALFDTPIFMGFYSLDKFEQLAEQILTLILQSIERR